MLVPGAHSIHDDACACAWSTGLGGDSHEVQLLGRHGHVHRRRRIEGGVGMSRLEVATVVEGRGLRRDDALHL